MRGLSLSVSAQGGMCSGASAAVRQVAQGRVAVLRAEQQPDGGMLLWVVAGSMPVLVHPNNALLRLKQFVEAESGVSQPGDGAALSSTRAAAASIAATTATAKQSMHAGTGGSAGSSSPTAGAPAGAFQGQAVSRRAADRECEYWERLTRAVGDRVVRVWGKLEQQLGAYHKLLVRRGEGLGAIARLQAENEELRALLNQYLGSKINAELQIPPMAVL